MVSFVPVEGRAGALLRTLIHQAAHGISNECAVGKRLQLAWVTVLDTEERVCFELTDSRRAFYCVRLPI